MWCDVRSQTVLTPRITLKTHASSPLASLCLSRTQQRLSPQRASAQSSILIRVLENNNLIVLRLRTSSPGETLCVSWSDSSKLGLFWDDSSESFLQTAAVVVSMLFRNETRSRKILIGCSHAHTHTQVKANH